MYMTKFSGEYFSQMTAESPCRFSQKQVYYKDYLLKSANLFCEFLRENIFVVHQDIYYYEYFCIVK